MNPCANRPTEANAAGRGGLGRAGRDGAGRFGAGRDGAQRRAAARPKSDAMGGHAGNVPLCGRTPKRRSVRPPPKRRHGGTYRQCPPVGSHPEAQNRGLAPTSRGHLRDLPQMARAPGAANPRPATLWGDMPAMSPGAVAAMPPGSVAPLAMAASARCVAALRRCQLAVAPASSQRGASSAAARPPAQPLSVTLRGRADLAAPPSGDRISSVLVTSSPPAALRALAPRSPCGRLARRPVRSRPAPGSARLAAARARAIPPKRLRPSRAAFRRHGPPRPASPRPASRGACRLAPCAGSGPTARGPPRGAHAHGPTVHGPTARARPSARVAAAQTLATHPPSLAQSTE